MLGVECARVAAVVETQHGLNAVLERREPNHDGDDTEDDAFARYGTTFVSFTTGSTTCDAACGVRYTLIVAAL